MTFTRGDDVQIEPYTMRADIAGFGDYSGFQGAKGAIVSGPTLMAFSGDRVPTYSVEFEFLHGFKQTVTIPEVCLRRAG